jgi:hypothetical protein
VGFVFGQSSLFLVFVCVCLCVLMVVVFWFEFLDGGRKVEREAFSPNRNCI